MRSTKKSLIMSMISLILCFAMLLGSTYAWFTDEVTSGTNKIIAGNLDIDVSYYDGSTWTSIEGVDSLFDKNALWEPGHTEYVTLKIENKGTLALKYQLNVSPISESGGVNMAGQSFKLSDYLVFKTTGVATTAPTYANRQAARDAATGTEMKLNQAGLSKSNTLLAKAAGATENPAEYITLVVYMPDTVGNEANYKTGTVAPTIDLGIKVVATQVENEEDSFGNNYDAGAKTVAPFSVGPIYDYFPQVVKTVDVIKDDQNKVSTQATIEVKESADENAQLLASVEIPAGVQLDANVDKLTLKVTPQELADNSYSATALASEMADENREIANFDVKVEGVAPNNGTNLTVNVFIGKGLADVKIYHNGNLINGTSYNSSTGIATFQTKTFSDYTMAYDKAVAAIGTQTYGTLELAIAAAQDGETITMLKNSAGAGISVPKGVKTFTVDFNGFTYTADEPLAGSTGTKTQAFQLNEGNTITFKNGKLTSSQAKMLIQNYANLTLDNMVLDGTKLIGSKYALSNNCGNVTIKDTTITAANDGVAFDVYGGFQEYGDVTVTVTGNSVIIGKIEVARGSGISNKNTLIINGGTINGDLAVTPNTNTTVSITGGTFSSDPSAYVADGYKATKSGNVWTVSFGVVQIGGSEYPSLAEAIATDETGETIKMLCDMDITDVNFPKDTEMDLGGHTITSNNANAIANGKNLTMKNGELKFTDDHSFTYIDVRPGDSTNGVYTFEGMKFTSVKKGPSYSCTDRIQELVKLNANDGGKTEFVFKDCTFTNAKAAFTGYNGGGSFDATFENCTFTGLGSSEFIDASNNNVSGTITIKNCTFTMEATSSSAAAIDANKNVTVTFEGTNTVNITSATPVTGSENPYDDVKLYSDKTVTSAHVVSGAAAVSGIDTVTVSGIATK